MVDHQGRTGTLLAAAIVEALEACAVLVAAIAAAISTGQGRSYQTSSGVAITLIGIGTAVALGCVALGLARARRWARTPALLTQLFSGIVGIYLLQSHQFLWGIPLLALAISGFGTLLAPASLSALHRSTEPPR